MGDLQPGCSAPNPALTHPTRPTPASSPCLQGGVRGRGWGSTHIELESHNRDADTQEGWEVAAGCLLTWEDWEAQDLTFYFMDFGDLGYKNRHLPLL